MATKLTLACAVALACLTFGAAAASATMVQISTLSNNAVGIFAQAATVYIGEATVSGNAIGWQTASGGEE